MTLRAPKGKKIRKSFALRFPTTHGFLAFAKKTRVGEKSYLFLLSRALGLLVQVPVSLTSCEKERGDEMNAYLKVAASCNVQIRSFFAPLIDASKGSTEKKEFKTVNSENKGENENFRK